MKDFYEDKTTVIKQKNEGKPLIFCKAVYNLILSNGFYYFEIEMICST